MWPKVERTRSNSPSSNGRSSASASTHSTSTPAASALARAASKWTEEISEPTTVGSAQGSRNRDRTAAARADVEDAHALFDADRVQELRAGLLDVVGYAVPLSGGPDGAVHCLLFEIYGHRGSPRSLAWQTLELVVARCRLALRSLAAAERVVPAPAQASVARFAAQSMKSSPASPKILSLPTPPVESVLREVA